MCERYVLPDQAAAEREFLPAQPWWKFKASFNVAAQQYVPAIRIHDGQSEGTMLRWGLIPGWAKDPGKLPPLFNARADTAAEKASFKAAM